MEEIWKDVKGYEGLYQVSNFGNVKSLIRNKILKLSYSHNGYRLVSLRRKTFRVHRLVAEAFISNPNNFSWVNHKDENKENNCVDNLEWCSASYNINYGDRNNKVAKKVSIWRKKKGSDYSPRERKRVAQYTLGDKFVKEFRSINEAGIETNSSIGTIYKCCVGTSKTCNGYKWKFLLESQV